MPRKNETHSTDVGCYAPPTGAMTLMSMDEETLSKRRNGTAQWVSSVDTDPQPHARPHLTFTAPTVHIHAFKKRAMRLKSCWSADGHPSPLSDRSCTLAWEVSARTRLARLHLPHLHLRTAVKAGRSEDAREVSWRQHLGNGTGANLNRGVCTKYPGVNTEATNWRCLCLCAPPRRASDECSCPAAWAKT